MALNVQCKKCANLRNDWCKLVFDSPDPDMVRDCQYYRGKTNADRLRQMSDDELARWIAGYVLNITDGRQLNDATAAWLDWLGQEANDVDWLEQEVESDA